MSGSSSNFCIITSVSGIIILLAIVFYNRYVLRKGYHLKVKQMKEEISSRDLLLKKVIGEKEWLLREIHHRVKNNLQIVISLLNTQSAYLHNEDALEAIRKSQHRMYAISLIHQKLYQSDNLAEIDMKWYIKELVAYMEDSFITGGKIRFVLKKDAVKLDVAQAVPVGLILNEAISNAIKYAFPANRKGMIEISFTEGQDNNVQLKIADNGIGLPATYDAEHTDSLGMSLINGLTKQLNGEINISNAGGLSLEIRFKRHKGLPERSDGNMN